MKKLGLIVIGLALLPIKAFSQDLSPADCLLLEKMIDLPELPGSNQAGTIGNGTNVAYPSTNPLSKANPTPEERLQEAKDRFARHEKERQADRNRFGLKKAQDAQLEAAIKARVDHLKEIFGQGSCEDKIKSIHDQMGCLAIDLTLSEVDPLIYGSSAKMSGRKSSYYPNKATETDIEKQIREINEKDDMEDEKLSDEIDAYYAQIDSKRVATQMETKKRLLVLKNTAKANCVDSFNSLTEKVKNQ